MIDTVLSPDDKRGRRWYGILFLAASIVVCLPVWLVEYPPLVDYPNHLVRLYVVWNYDDVEVFQQRYERVFAWQPNLAMEAIVLPLQLLLPVEVAGKVFLSLTLLLLAVGCHQLGRAVHGSPTWLALFGFFAGYNSMWFYGFVNYCFGLGMFLVALAAWMHWRQSMTLLAGLGVAILVFLCRLSHLSAYIFVAGSVLAVVFVDWLQHRTARRRLLLQIVPVLPELLFFLDGGGGSSVVVWNTLQGKFVGLLCMVLTYDNRIDATILVLLLAMVGVVLWQARRWSAHKGLLLAAVGFLVLFVVCPNEMLGGSPADTRFVPPFALLAVLACRFEVPANWGRGILACFLGLTLVRLAVVGVEWTAASRQIAAQVTLLDQLPLGARVYPAVTEGDVTAVSKRDRCCLHVVHYATIRRQAFAPTILANPRNQPIRLKADVTKPGQAAGRAEHAPLTMHEAIAHYDYVLCFAMPAKQVALLHMRCDFVAEGGNSILFRPRPSKGP